jgi:ribosomal protein L40E
VGLFGGKLPELGIQLERADGVYYAGEVVRARVTVSAEDGAKFKEVRAGLLLEEKYQTIERRRDSDGDTTYSRVWRTSEQWAAREQLAAGELPKGYRQTFDFEWRLPDEAAPTCQGKIVVARWLVKATVDRKMARDVNAEAQLYVVAPAPAHPTPGGQFSQENSAPELALMRFELPRIEYVQGETVTGRLHVDARQDLSPRAVQITLSRHEVVPGGDRVHAETVVEARHDYDAQLYAFRPAAFNFALAVPARWCPVYHSAHARVEWRVTAALDLAWKRDVHAWQGVYVYNGAARSGGPEQVAFAAQPPAAQSPLAAPVVPRQNICRGCGSRLMPGALFCGNCGAQVAPT